MPTAAAVAPGAAGSRPRPARRPWSTSGWLLLLAMLVFAFGLVASRPSAPADLGPPTGDVLAAQNAIEALVHPGPQPTALALLPKDYTAVMGVVPAALPARDGTVRAVHPGGGCSAPWGDDNTEWDYSVPCKAHDLGYDLLRYAARKGHPLAPDLRAALDDRLSRDMHHTCVLNPMNSERTCRLVATMYSAGLVLNSWHQRWGPPTNEPVGPMFAGVLVIACLLAVRLRGWLRNRRAPALTAPDPNAVPEPIAEAASPTRWTVLGVAAMAVLVLGESAVALARWAGADGGRLWPLTWLAQLAPVFFFAGGKANVAGWDAERAEGGGYRAYLARRTSWLLRSAPVFVLVALVVPLALEVLSIPDGTNATVVRIALHPLWLLGVYLLTVVATPGLLWLHRCHRHTALAPIAALFALFAVVVLGEPAVGWLGSPMPRYAATLALALLAQQLSFVRTRLPRPLLFAAAAGGLGALAVVSAVEGAPPTLLDTRGAPPALSGPVWGVLLLGIAQLGVLGLLSRPLGRLSDRPLVHRAVRFALGMPMSLYLVFLAAMLVLVELVYLPEQLGDGPGRTLSAVGLVALPAAAVFWWFERRRRHPLPESPPGPQSVRPPVAAPRGRRLSTPLARAATVFGLGYAVLGVFGFALTRFGDSTEALVAGLRLDPITSLIHLLLGVFLLHTVRLGTSCRPSTWAVTALACGPAILFAADGFEVDAPTGAALAGLTGAFALAAMAVTLLPARAAATAG